MYHTDVILHIWHVFDTVRNICVRCSLWNLANTYISSTMCGFENCFFLKKSKYHVCVILSRLCDTLNVMDGQVSRRRDSITQTWYFDSLWKKTIFKITQCWGNVWISKVLKRAPLADTYFNVKILPEMKYHVCVIVSRRCDLPLTD